MKYNRDHARQRLVDDLDKKSITYEIHYFDSGSSMIDIWYDNKFYVIQLEDTSLGLSLINEENPGFDTIPDQRFFDLDNFFKVFNDVIK